MSLATAMKGSHVIGCSVSERRTKLILTGCFLSSFLATYLIMGTMTASPVIVEDLGFDKKMVAPLGQMGCMAAIQFALIAIVLSDKYGKRASAVAGLVVIMVTSLTIPLTTDPWTFSIARVICGLGIVLLQASTFSILADVSTRSELEMNVALSHSLSCAGALMGTVGAVAVIDCLSWRALILLSIPISIAIWMLIRHADNVVVRPGLKIDYVKHALYIAFVMAVFFGMFFPSDYSYLYAVAGALLVLIVISERSDRGTDRTLFRYSLLKNSMLVTPLVVGIMFNFASSSVNIVTANYLQLIDKSGVNTVSALLIVAAVALGLKPLVQAILSPVFARWYEGRPKNLFLQIGFIAVAIGSAIMLSIWCADNMTSLVVITVSTILLAIGTSSFQPMNRSLVMESVDESERNSASSLVSVSDSFGRMFGTVLLVNLLNVTEKTLSGITDDLMLICSICTVVCIAGVYIVIRRAKA